MSTMQGQRDAGTEEVLREWVWQHGIQTGVNGSKANRETVQAVTQHTARGVEASVQKNQTHVNRCFMLPKQSQIVLCTDCLVWGQMARMHT